MPGGSRAIPPHTLASSGPSALRLLQKIMLGSSLLLGSLSYPSRAGETMIEVPAELTGKILFLQGKANDKGPMTFILDTGATETVLTPSAAEKAGFKISTPSPQTPTKVILKSFSVGDATVPNLLVHVFDPPQALSLRLDRGIDYKGIIGYTFLNRYVTSIDYKSRKVKFIPLSSHKKEDEKKAAAEGRIVVPFQIKDGLIHVNAELNDQVRMTLVLDTGSAEVLLLPHTAPSIEEKAAPLPGIEGAKHVTLDSLSVGAAKATGIHAIIHAPPQERLKKPSYDGILGYPFLSKFTVVVNYRDKQVVFVPNPADKPDGAQKQRDK